MKRTMKHILIILLAVSLFSCKTKKVEKTEYKEQTTEHICKDSLNIQHNEQNVVVKNDSIVSSNQETTITKEKTIDERYSDNGSITQRITSEVISITEKDSKNKENKVITKTTTDTTTINKSINTIDNTKSITLEEKKKSLTKSDISCVGVIILAVVGSLYLYYNYNKHTKS